jgi:hypothetical protein
MKKGRPDRRPEPPKCPQPTPPKRSFSSPQSRPSAWRARAALRRLDRFRESDILRYVFERVVAGCMVNGLVKGEGFAVDASAMEANASLYRGKAPDELDWTNAQRQKRRWPSTWQHWRPKLDRKTRQNAATATAQMADASVSRHQSSGAHYRADAASPWRSARALNPQRSDSGGHHVGRCRTALLPSRGHPGTWPNPRGR